MKKKVFTLCELDTANYKTFVFGIVSLESSPFFVVALLCYKIIIKKKIISRIIKRLNPFLTHW